MSGVVAGGWEFVIAAYVVSGIVLGGYLASVLVRYRTEQNRQPRE